MVKLDVNNEGEPLGLVAFTEYEFEELIRLIDDDPVDEDLLAVLRGRLRKRQARLRKRVREFEAVTNGG